MLRNRGVPGPPPPWVQAGGAAAPHFTMTSHTRTVTNHMKPWQAQLADAANEGIRKSKPRSKSDRRIHKALEALQ